KVEEVFKHVRVAVAQRSHGAQTPWESSSLTGDFVFNPPAPPAAAPAPQAAMVAPTAPDRTIHDLDATFVTLRTVKVRVEPNALSKRLDTLPPDTVVKVTGRIGTDWLRVAWRDEQAYVSAPQLQEVDEGEIERWGNIKGTKSPDQVEAFLHSYPNGFYAARAKALLDGLHATPQQVAMAAPQSRATAPHAADQTFRDCPNCPQMVALPGGSFAMGSNGDPSEKPVRHVTIAPFAIG